MNENFDSKNYINDNLNLNTEENDFENLISRLKEIKKTISFLEKTISPDPKGL